jgi:hypothetical protein
MIAPFTPTHLILPFAPSSSLQPYEPCHGRCVATPPSTAYRFFHPTASPPERPPGSRLGLFATLSLSPSPSPAGPLLVSERNAPLFQLTVANFFKAILPSPIPTSPVSPNHCKRTHQRPLTPIRLPCLPARSENIYAARLGLLNRRSIEELHRSSQIQAKCWTQDSPGLVVKVAPGKLRINQTHTPKLRPMLRWIRDDSLIRPVHTPSKPFLVK